jgi:hypothetical protein
VHKMPYTIQHGETISPVLGAGSRASARWAVGGLVLPSAPGLFGSAAIHERGRGGRAKEQRMGKGATPVKGGEGTTSL